jgi:uncharacterized membrane protein
MFKIGVLAHILAILWNLIYEFQIKFEFSEPDELWYNN